MTAPKTYAYVIHYNDNTYMTYDLTRADYEKLENAVLDDEKYVTLQMGLLCLTDIRAIIEQREPEITEELPSADPALPADIMGYLNTLRGSES